MQEQKGIPEFPFTQTCMTLPLKERGNKSLAGTNNLNTKS